MKMSQMFGGTLREAPAEAEVKSYQLLLRAGYIRQLAAGVFSYLPLARRALTRIENIMRAEMDAIGGQELTMPVVTPGDLWKESNRWYKIDAEMARLKDRNGRDMALAMTHEEVVSDLVRREIHSYRQLPRLIYHIQTKFRDDPRPRAGLIRVREFTMKDSIQPGRRLGRPGTPVPGPLPGVFQHLSPLRPAGDRGQIGRRHDGRQAGPRIHVPDPHRRGHSVAVR